MIIDVFHIETTFVPKLPYKLAGMIEFKNEQNGQKWWSIKYVLYDKQHGENLDTDEIVQKIFRNIKSYLIRVGTLTLI